jgi:1-acyl-sn-glycerol-3-phosphate acyltransferase
MSEKKTKKSVKKWIKLRHRVVRNIAYAILGPVVYLKYGMRVQKFKEQEKRPYLILYNHQTAFDQFFVGMAFRGPVYYVASDDLFSNGLVSKLLRYLVAPIPIKKQTTDVHAVINCIRVAREGGTIAIAPEGNRTYSGETCYMNPAIIGLAKKLSLPIALYRIEGGYGVQPRWSDVTRKGRMKGYVSRVLQPEEYADWSNEELMKTIEAGLYVDEGVKDATFFHKKSAEYLERAVYVCPTCGLSTFESHGDVITCKICGRQVRYLPTKELEGIGFDFPFRFVKDWYRYQCNFMNQLDLSPYKDTPMYRDTVAVSEVVAGKKKIRLGENTAIRLYGDRIELNGAEGESITSYSFDEIAAVTVLGKNKVNVYVNKTIYQFKGDKRFNALRYVNTFYHYKNLQKGDQYGEFLGL